MQSHAGCQEESRVELIAESFHLAVLHYWQMVVQVVRMVVKVQYCLKAALLLAWS